MDFEELKSFLDYKAELYENASFIDNDPIQLPHRFSRKEDIEIVAFIVSQISWGNRKSIINSGEKIIQIMENQPYEFIINYKDYDIKNSNFVHRTFNSIDLDFFFRSLQKCYQLGNLENYFEANPEYPGIKGRIINFRSKFFNIPHEHRSQKHLSNPLKNSACKRLNMLLRWMVRSPKKGVDFGLWQHISPGELYLPLDVHTSKNARELTLLTRKQDDWKALEEIMYMLKKLDAQDPVKYDFALFGLGIFEKF